MNKFLTVQDVENALRGYARLVKIDPQRAGFSAVFSVHDKPVRITKRADGVLFVNCGGRTALLTKNVRVLRAEIALALRSIK